MGGIAAIVVLSAFLAVILRQQRPEQAMAVALIAGIGILALVLMRITPVISTLQELLGAADMPGEYGLILFKALGDLPDYPVGIRCLPGRGRGRPGIQGGSGGQGDPSGAGAAAVPENWGAGGIAD